MEGAAAGAGGGSKKFVFVDPKELGININALLGAQPGFNGPPGGSLVNAGSNGLAHLPPGVGLPPGGGLVYTGSNGSNFDAANLGKYGNNNNNKATAAAAAKPLPKSILKKRAAANSVIHDERGLVEYVIPRILHEVSNEMLTKYATTLKSVVERLSPTFGDGLTSAEKEFIIDRILSDVSAVPETTEGQKKKQSRIVFDGLVSKLFAEAIETLTNSNMNYIDSININGEKYEVIKEDKFAALSKKVHEYIKERIDAPTYNKIKDRIDQKLDKLGPRTVVDEKYANEINRRTAKDEEYYYNLVGTKQIGKLGSPEFKNSEPKYVGGRKTRRRKRTLRK